MKDTDVVTGREIDSVTNIQTERHIIKNTQTERHRVKTTQTDSQT